MSQKIRIDSIKLTGYIFHSFPGLVFHSGKFFMNEKTVKEVYNNGSIAIMLYGKKYGKEKLLRKLRTEAVKCEIELIQPPF
jgi:hypothetical protein